MKNSYKKAGFNESVFRDYDIRGIYPSQINEDFFYLLGRAVAEYLNVDEIAVGHDTRLSSPTLFKALTEGIRERGVNVVNLGLISTEINYFASGHYGFPANIIVSASHNPPEYNGLKIVKKGVVPLHGSLGLPEIKKIALKNIFPVKKKRGEIRKKLVLSDWIKHLLSLIDLSSINPLKIVIDAGNGMAGPTWEQLKEKLPVKIIPLYFDPDGRFPNHLPDPLNKNNLKDLQKKIRETSADLGFALDGDADRLFVVDNNGKPMSGTITCAMLAKHLLNKKGPSPVLYSVTCGRIVPETINKYRGQPVKTRVGHSFIKAEMKKWNAVFAGEHSGHFYFRDNYYADSSSVAGLFFLEYLSAQKKSLSVLRTDFETHYSSDEINFSVDDGKKIFHNLINAFPGSKVDKTDGVTVAFPQWWFNARASKTEPLIRVNVEADSLKLLDEKLDVITKTIESSGGSKKKAD